MTAFASIALFRHIDSPAVQFLDPRWEGPKDVPGARRAAARFWRGRVRAEDGIMRSIMLVRQAGPATIEIHERQSLAGKDRPWVTRKVHAREIDNSDPALVACARLLDIDAEAAPPPMPDVLEINGVIYRREI